MKDTSKAPQIVSHNQSYRAEIDGLRAFAVLSVVIFHAFPSLLTGGFVGVDVFFVISGFLITSHIFQQLDEKTFSLSNFFGRRIRRIFPALALVMIASLTFGWFALLADEYAQLGKHVASGATFILNFMLVGESGYFDNAAETKPLLHLWSLAVEEQFYILWPLALWTAWRRGFSLLTITILATLTSFTLNALYVSDKPIETFFWPIGRFWELLCGSILAWFTLYRREKQKLLIDNLNKVFLRIIYIRKKDPEHHTVANISSILGLFLLFLGVIHIEESFKFPGVWAVIPVLGTVLVIAAGAQARPNQLIFMNPIAIWIGLISYPLYLWHWPILSFLQIIEGSTPGRGERVIAILLSVLLAWFTYKFVEKPIRAQRLVAPNATTLFILIMLIGSTGLYIERNQGIPERSSISIYTSNLDELKRTIAKEKACEESVPLETIEFDYCKISEKGDKGTVAIIGDSHAHVAFPGIAEGLLPYGITTLMLANSSCPPLIGSPWGRNTNEKIQCTKKIEQIFGSLSSIKDLKAVLFFSRGPTYWTGTEPAKKKVSKPSLTIESFFQGLQKSIVKLNALGVKVIYVTENPELTLRARSCLPRPFNTSIGDRCAQSIDTVMHRQHEYRKRLTKLTGDIAILDANNAFCDLNRNSCYAIDEIGQLLYADDDHISVIGSRRQFEKLILPFIRDNQLLKAE